MNILDLYTEDKFTAKKEASSHGGEWAGPCPFCGGNDRFRIQPFHGTTGGRFWCRQCGQKGDAIDYLKLVRNIGYLQACDLLDIRPRDKTSKTYTIHTGKDASMTNRYERWSPKTYDVPPKLWQDKAREIVGQAISNLWSNDFKNICEWLNRSRFLDDEDGIRPHHLGYIATDLYLDRPIWGLPEDPDENGKARKLWIPEGILIPTFQPDLIRLRVRRFTEQSGKKYIFIPGGSPAPSIIDNNHEVTFVLESDLDAFLMNQEVGDLLNFIALGSLAMRPDTKAHDLIRRSRMTLIAFDNDANLSGSRTAWTWWRVNYPLALRCPVPFGKDPTEAKKNGLDLRLWVEAAVEGGAMRMTM